MNVLNVEVLLERSLTLVDHQRTHTGRNHINVMNVGRHLSKKTTLTVHQRTHRRETLYLQ